jgi:AcrR family transcriptional regulator
MEKATLEAGGKERRWTPTFERLPEEKRERVLAAARRAFGAHGFAGANINKIADDAGISVGSMYKYVRTKEDLFLALIEESHAQIEGTIDGILAANKGFKERAAALLEAAVRSSLEDPDSVRLYIACTTEELSSLAGRLSSRIEAVSAVRYRAMVAEAKARGELDASLDDGWAAFFLDDLLLLAQFSSGSLYYRERLRLFLDRDDSAWSPEELVSELLTRIMRSLAPR